MHCTCVKTLHVKDKVYVFKKVNNLTTTYMCMHDHIYRRNSHWTSMVMFLISGFPTPFCAVHLKSLTSCLLIPTRGMVTTLLSKGLVQMTLGIGLPSATHFSVTFPPSIADTIFLEISVMRGETASKKGRTEQTSLIPCIWMSIHSNPFSQNRPLQRKRHKMWLNVKTSSHLLTQIMIKI